MAHDPPEQIELVELVMTCERFPSQWEGRDGEGRWYYVRYRHNWFEVDRAASRSDWWEDVGVEELVRVNCIAERSWGGRLPEALMLDLAGFRLAEGVRSSMEVGRR